MSSAKVGSDFVMLLWRSPLDAACCDADGCSGVACGSNGRAARAWVDQVATVAFLKAQWTRSWLLPS